MTSRIRLGAAALAVAGVCFVLYPAIRPYSSEAGLDGAAAFGSSAWLVAHMLAMLGFTLVMIGLVAVYLALLGSPAERLAFGALITGLAGIGLTLPFYGGEAFGLHAIGEEALREHNGALVDLASTVRGQPELTMFLIGLLLVAAAAIAVAVAISRSRRLSRWSGVPFALGFSLFIPQFYGTPAIRVAHGLLITLGCLWIAVELWRARA